MELPRRIPYNPKWRAIVFCVLFFGACTVGLAHMAMTNDRGAMIVGITLGREGATVFCWIMAALSGGFVLIGFILAIRRVASPKIFELGTDALLLPHGRFQSRLVRIAYADIQGLSEVQVQHQVFLYVMAGGVKYTITASMFPDKGTYVEVRDFLKSAASSSAAAAAKHRAGGDERDNFVVGQS